MTTIFIPAACLAPAAPNIVLIGNKTDMFEVKMRLALIQSLFYPPQAIHVHGVDLLDDVRCLLKNLIVELKKSWFLHFVVESRRHAHFENGVFIVRNFTTD